jgi:hypothetical protein
MSSIFSLWTLILVGILAIVGLVIATPPDAALWATSLLALLAAVWLLGGRRAYRVLLWLIAVNWLQITGRIISSNLAGQVVSDDLLGPYQVRAIIWSLCALLTLALGMRLGTKMGRRVLRPPVRTERDSLAGSERSVQLNRIVLCYGASLLVTQVIGGVAYSIPALTQALLSLNLIKFVCVYLLAAKVFETGRGYHWLILMTLVELITGLTGYFSSYKEAFIVILIALASSRRPLSVGMWIFGGTAAIAVIWVSLIWTVNKKEYRREIVFSSIEQRIEWMAQRVLFDTIDYHDAVIRLFQRVGYTDFYAQVLAREGSLPNGFNYYASAVQTVLTPRILFPDKQALNDSRLTTELLGIRIEDDTSIGVGYVAQAQVDFGFPGLLPPILLIGFMIGVAAQYFMTRSAPLLIREAFTTAALFHSFQFESNIDKSLGGFLISCLGMGFILKFGYPLIARWLAGSRLQRRGYSDATVGQTSSRQLAKK